MSQVIFICKLCFFLFLTLTQLVVLKIQSASVLIGALLLLGFSTYSLVTQFDTATTDVQHSLSPTLSGLQAVYPQDAATELLFWEYIHEKQPTHKMVLYNQYILNDFLKTGKTTTLLSRITQVDPLWPQLQQVPQ